jgi:hypothetical protein
VARGLFIGLAVAIASLCACTGEDAAAPTTTTSEDTSANFDERALEVCEREAASTALENRTLVAAFDTTGLKMLQAVLGEKNVGLFILPQDSDNPASLCWYSEARSRGDDDQSPLLAVGYSDRSTCFGQCENPVAVGPEPQPGPPRRP